MYLSPIDNFLHPVVHFLMNSLLPDDVICSIGVPTIWSAESKRRCLSALSTCVENLDILTGGFVLSFNSLMIILVGEYEDVLLWPLGLGLVIGGPVPAVLGSILTEVVVLRGFLFLIGIRGLCGLKLGRWGMTCKILVGLNVTDFLRCIAVAPVTCTGISTDPLSIPLGSSFSLLLSSVMRTRSQIFWKFSTFLKSWSSELNPESIMYCKEFCTNCQIGQTAAGLTYATPQIFLGYLVILSAHSNFEFLVKFCVSWGLRCRRWLTDFLRVLTQLPLNPFWIRNLKGQEYLR